MSNTAIMVHNIQSNIFLSSSFLEIFSHQLFIRCYIVYPLLCRMGRQTLVSDSKTEITLEIEKGGVLS
jgi:hypothetical protein